MGSFHPAPLTGGPITGFGDIFRAYSVGGVFTVPAYGSDGNVEVGPGGVAKFVLPGGIEGLFFVNARVNPSIITGEDVHLVASGRRGYQRFQSCLGRPSNSAVVSSSWRPYHTLSPPAGPSRGPDRQSALLMITS